MAKIDLQELGSLTDEQAAMVLINQNSADIEALSDSFLSRDGVTPNHMVAALDMNSNRVLNLPTPVNELEPLRLKDLNDFKGSGQVFPISTLPTGGATGLVLTKASAADFDTIWAESVVDMPYVYVSDFGAVGNGSTDDTAALNAAFASLAGESGTVVFDIPGFHKVTSSIIVGQLTGSGVTSFINIECPYGAVLSGLKWFGATNGECIVFAKNKYFRCNGLGLYNQVAKGTTIGIVLGGDNSGFGNQTLQGVFNSCLIQGFATGINAGGHSGATSEMTFNDLNIQNCDLGFIPTDFNSLDFNFNMLGISGCGVGISTGVVSGFNVNGGSASFNGVDFEIGSNSQHTTIKGFRSEVATRFIQQGASAFGSVSVEDCLVVSPPSPFVSIEGTFTSLSVSNSSIAGFINLNPFTRSVKIENCRLNRWDTAHKLAGVMSTTGDPARQTHAVFKGNVDTGAFPARVILDYEGTLGSRSSGSATNVLSEPVIRVEPADITTDPSIGINTLALNHVKHLGEGTIPNSASSTSPTPGKNLRVSGTFATSNTLAFTFTRTLTTNADASDVVTATAGVFYPTDVGKRLLITAGADTGADWYGYIERYITSTTVGVVASSFASPGGRNPQGNGKTATVGENEPDANYIVAGIAGNQNETFWVDTQTSSGFTLHSSNASSVAHVNVLLVR